MLAHLTIPIKKVDSLSNEDWSESHPKAWLSVKVVQEKVIQYSQFHVDHQTTAALRAHDLPFADYDGGVNIWAATVEDLMSVSTVLARRRFYRWLMGRLLGSQSGKSDMFCLVNRISISLHSEILMLQ
ncbi:hypothetical protein MMC13_001304 [Lambiella insularis]|nr:hypothetical protein [Lambiella insularis]